MLRWGLWMSPIINTFLRQSRRPLLVQSGRRGAHPRRDRRRLGLPNADFRDFSLSIFLGLLAYDWLRIIIWFDHMGLRVATLVNLSFLGGDRADEAAGRFLGHGARTRAIPDGIRRFGTWAPLLIPFYIPRGAEWDKAWTGAEALSRGGAMPGAGESARRSPMLAAGVGFARRRLGRRQPAARPQSAPPDLSPTTRSLRSTEPPVSFSLNNGARRRRNLARRARRGERDGRCARRLRRSISSAGRSIPLQSRGQFFYLIEGDEKPWSIGFEPARRVGEYSVRLDQLQRASRSRIRSIASRRRWQSRPTQQEPS